MFRVLIPDCLAPPATLESTILEGLATVECLQLGSRDDLTGKLDHADGILLYHEIELDRKVIENIKQCQAIVRCGVGYDNVDLEAAAEKGIVVSNVPDYGVDEVADHAIGLMLACSRRFLIAERQLKERLEPWERAGIGTVTRLSGQTLGIIGCGRIGTATARRARAFGLKILIHDPYLRPGTDKALDVKQVSLEELLEVSDIVSLHTPLTPETHHLINRETLALMKRGAILVNTARGAVVDTDALAEVLENGHLDGAGIDVLPEEPPRDDLALIRLWKEADRQPINLIITPHTAYYSEQGVVEMRQKGAEELARILRGEAPMNQVRE